LPYPKPIERNFEGSKLKVGMISTFRVQCGVAQYTEALCQELTDLVNLTVYAEDVWQQEREEPPISGNSKNAPTRYIRCWNRRHEPYDELYDKIIDDLPDIIHIQYDTAMYGSKQSVLDFIQRLHRAGIKTVMTLHEVPFFRPTVYANWYEKAGHHFITTNKLMHKELKKWHRSAKSTIIPLGSTIFQPLDRFEARRELNISQYNYYIVQFGYWGIDKGMLPLIECMPKILEKIPNAILAFAGGLHPLAPQVHKDYVKKCIQTALKLKLQGKVIFTKKLLFGKEIDVWLSAADIIVLNHQTVFGAYNASACGHRILCSKRPIIMNDKAVSLWEFEDGVDCVKSSNKELGDKIITLSKNSELQERIVKRALNYAQETSFKNIAEQHLEVYKKIVK